ncbi:hypothetical protein I2750_19555 [Bacillus sp. PR5]|nr:hypothetical protein [Bacillus sp. PR5]
MKDRPILFSAPMIRAILDGRKTQTRRVLDAWCDEPPAFVEDGVVTAFDENDRPYRWPRTNAVGDRLWVREAHYLTDDGDYERAVYAADADDVRLHLSGVEQLRACHPNIDWSKHERLRPSIHMPRWASRITQIVTDVRVQRLQDISKADAIAEGIELVKVTKQWGNHWRNYGADGMTDRSAKYSFQTLWTIINGHKKMVSWNDNPWVTAYTFTPIFQNIDQIAEAA